LAITASGRQEAATREIANTMRSVAATSQRTAAAMAELEVTTERSNVLSQTASVASTDIGDVDGMLHTEVNPFLHPMAQDDIYGRHYKRLPCYDAAATLIAPGIGTAIGSTEMRVAIENISRCVAPGAPLGPVGWAMPCNLQCPAHQPGLMRGWLGTAATLWPWRFRQDEETLTHVDAAITVLGCARTPLA
jgi:hypothetical protein